MELIVGSVVCSKAGRDKDNYFVVVAIEGEAVFLADGKLRKLQKPKRKNRRHIALTGRVIPIEQVSDKALYRQLAAFNSSMQVT